MRSTRRYGCAGLSRQLVTNVEVEYRLLATNAAASEHTTTVRVREASSHLLPGRFGAHRPTAASNVSR